MESRQEIEIQQLQDRIKSLELENTKLKQSVQSQNASNFSKIDEFFTDDEYKRYGRQMIVPQFGSRSSQIKLKKSKVLVVGAGGLGSPALLYLAASGVGIIGIIDDDIVDTSNLHRQIIHNTETVGLYKAESAKQYLSKLNPHVNIITYCQKLTNENSFDIISEYDLVLDCTDHPAIRYLINDVCVLLNKTIVSGSGLKSDGQFTILNFKSKGPCYRCFYPSPPNPNSVTSCSDGGVIGPAIGLVGVAMVMETIKIITDFYSVDNFTPFLSSYSGYPHQSIRNFKMRNKAKNCLICREKPEITREMIESGELNYSSFCDRLETTPLDSKYRISVKDYREVEREHVLIDVRPKEQFEITKLKNSINVEWDPVFRKAEVIEQVLPDVSKDDEIYVICRFGNDSQLATQKLLDLEYKNVKDIIGGINKWSEDIDQTVPKY
ncbi:unnamed protein product [Candida verbasci]|uniref:Rhodanese domain-containing protein n=1 Tax=Candida verbasci TaxID=1227364 RepID=A0A9W4XFQ4_9ASCO|nr:unnamed protein product [Candida verbasci]